MYVLTTKRNEMVNLNLTSRVTVENTTVFAYLADSTPGQKAIVTLGAYDSEAEATLALEDISKKMTEGCRVIEMKDSYEDGAEVLSFDNADLPTDDEVPFK